FLRNSLVAKVAGGQSPLLQISSDERARAERIASAFSEEDLTRLLQIMLRTHAELGYRQEQRFHLELGLLKMVHAQRLLPLEQLLSGVEPARAAGGATGARVVSAPAGRSTAPAARSAPSAPTGAAGPSPFASDRARKTGDSKVEPPAGNPYRRESSSSAPEVIAGEAPTAPESA